MKTSRLSAFFLSLILVASQVFTFAADAHSEPNSKKFNASEFIFDHIGDSYEWHIFSYNNHHVSIPLPVIIYSNRSGFHIFMSYKLQHGKVFKGFKIAEEGKYRGKIVELKKINAEDVSLPLNFSITKNAFSIILISILLSVVFTTIAKRYQRNPELPPSGLQNVFEPFIIFIRNEIAIPSIGQNKYARFMPFLLTLFFFIWFANLLGLIPIFPGGANITGNISVTMALAIFTFIVVNKNGNKSYWKHIVSPPGIPIFLKLPIPIMPLVEFIGIFIKPFVLMVRLFANILAGHMVAVVFLSLIFIFASIKASLGFAVAPVSLLFLIFMSLLELLVALIQAYVFTLLSALYIGMAIEEHH